jgi:HupF/HypC family.|uniref:HypC/HybG/HupF family hydrogenase formation chaperone n=1 Tax=Ignisphaera aggregans TaxID=334771 RepID=A0A7J3Z7M1_9CREN
MCLGVLAKVVDVSGLVSKVSLGGAIVEVINGISDLKPGDVVIVHAGLIIQKVTVEGVISNLYAIYELQKAHYVFNGFSDEESSKKALEDIKKLGAELGLDQKLIEETISSFSEEEIAKFFT